MLHDLRALITATATRYGLRPSLIAGVVLTESGGDQAAWKPEGHYRYLVDVRTCRPFRRLTTAEIASEKAPEDFRALAGHPDQEWWAQQASWGLMQVMGGVARELGYTRPYLGRLLVDVDDNLDLGCRLLAGHVAWARGDTARALRAYNGGRGNADAAGTAPYPGKVRANEVAIERAWT
jgi:soluble lytic murein transglycosylase-like protein